MDALARAHYEVVFENAFLKRKANAFQDFFSEAMEKRYPNDFTRIRPWGNVGDRKCDGYHPSHRRLFQCHAPLRSTARGTVKKIRDDLAGALPFWREYFDTWIFVHNDRDGLGPDVAKALLDLGKQYAPLVVTHWGFEELRHQAMGLGEADLATLLGPAPTRTEMIDLGLESLAQVLDQVARVDRVPEPDLRPVPADKLTRNMLSSNVEVLLRAGMSRADLVRRYFTNKPRLQDQIAASFRARYAGLRDASSPDEVFAELQRFAGGDRVRNPGEQSAILAVLAFFFEECDIFERPEGGESRA
jgi:hypothetical protein